MKKIIYISDGISNKKYNAFSISTHSFPKQQMQRYNKTFLIGLSSVEGIKTEALSCIPFPAHRLIDSIKSEKESNCEYHYIPSSSNVLLRLLLNLFCAFFYVLTAPKGTQIIIDVLNISINKGAIYASKIRKFRICGLVTDIPEYLNTSDKIKKHMNNNICSCDSYILLSKKMSSAINPCNKPFLVIEGQIDDSNMQLISRSEKSTHKSCIYAGSLDKANGIDYLIEGFLRAHISDCTLEIYGAGNYSNIIKEIASKHSNIIYGGQIKNEELLPKLRKATLLINPRPTNQLFSMYSFPSKNMEYMASGTALLTTHIPSMPDEYLPYIFVLKDETAEGLEKMLRYIFSKPGEELYEMGKSAQNFVFSNKTGKIQAKKIVDFLFP